jgi:predicted TIM-barrel fold metal-dependent hydrolase
MTQPAKHPPVIDVHTHVFNARYLPLESIFLSQLKNPNWLARRIAANLARLLEESTGTSYEPLRALANVGTVDQLLAEIAGAIATEFDARVAGAEAAGARARHVRDDVADRLADDPVIRALAELEQLRQMSDDADPPVSDAVWSAREASAGLESETRLAARQLADEALDGTARSALGRIASRIKNAVRWALAKLWAMLDKLVSWWETFDELLTFARRMLMAERDILRELRDSYAGHGDLTVVHLMMDMQYAYTPPREPRYPFAEQLRRMRFLAGENPRTLLGFSAFDPRRPDPFVPPEGFAGVKFYPAMGYRPHGNDDPAIQAAVDTFFKTCVQHDLPVLTHCTPKGFQARAQAGLNAHPTYWADALVEFPALRLCLGHAGGGAMKNPPVESAGWFARSDAEWQHSDNFAAGVVSLCTSYPNVYCEFGHLDGVLDPAAGVAVPFERNFVREWSSQRGYPFASKAMFGSDHHMPGMIDKAARLLDYFRDLFGRHKLTGFEDFCGANASRYLKR